MRGCVEVAINLCGYSMQAEQDMIYLKDYYD
jgi:hypothetical protein